MIDAGQFRHPFTAQEDTGSSRNSKGEITASWTTHCELRGSLSALEGRESEAIRERFAEADYLVVTRHNSKTKAITPAMRLVLGSRTFDILANVDPDGRGKLRRIVVKERDL